MICLTGVQYTTARAPLLVHSSQEFDRVDDPSMTPQQRLERQRKQLKKRLGGCMWREGRQMLAGAGDAGSSSGHRADEGHPPLATLPSLRALPSPATLTFSCCCDLLCVRCPFQALTAGWRA